MQSDTVQITKLDNRANTLHFIGSVENVLNGIVPDDLRNRRFAAKDFRYGFEVGSPQGMINLGESIMLGGILYASRTDATRRERSALMWGPEFVTSGIFLIPETAVVSARARYFSFDTPVAVSHLYEGIYEQVRKPFAVAGCIECDNLASMAISHPPIGDRKIFEHRDYYYDEKEQNLANMPCAVVGVVSDPEDKALTRINEKLKSVLYFNPFAGAHHLSTHTHALTLQRPYLEIDDVHPHDADQVVHVMEASRVRYANLKIFAIDDLTPLTFT